jgi:diacylglycerol kinase (ATP)
MIEFITSRIASFGHAFHGWAFVVRYEKNAWIHAVATICVVIVATWLNVPLRDAAVLVLAVAMVWTAEILNTSIEAVVDLASPMHHPLAKIGKDVGAAAVLIAATAAVIIGLLILGPPLWHRLFG